MVYECRASSAWAVTIYESLLAWADFPLLKTRQTIAMLSNQDASRCLYTHLFFFQSPGIWTVDCEVFKIPCSSSRLQGLTLISLLFIPIQLPNGTIYLPGCVSVLVYLYLKAISVSFFADVFPVLLYHLLSPFVVFLC